MRYHMHGHGVLLAFSAKRRYTAVFCRKYSFQLVFDEIATDKDFPTEKFGIRGGKYKIRKTSPITPAGIRAWNSGNLKGCQEYKYAA
jgi:hypothetical protein